MSHFNCDCAHCDFYLTLRIKKKREWNHFNGLLGFIRYGRKNDFDFNAQQIKRSIQFYSKRTICRTITKLCLSSLFLVNFYDANRHLFFLSSFFFLFSFFNRIDRSNAINKAWKNAGICWEFLRRFWNGHLKCRRIFRAYQNRKFKRLCHCLALLQLKTVLQKRQIKKVICNAVLNENISSVDYW